MGSVRKIGDTYYIEFFARGLMYSQIAGPDLAMAEQMLAEVEAKIAGGEALTIVRDIELIIFLDQFLEDAKRHFPTKTTQRYNSTARHFSSFFHQHYPRLIHLSKVTPSVVESYQGHLVQDKTTPQKVNFTLLLLRDIMDYGIKIGFLNDNPTVHVRLLPMPKSKRPTTARWQMAQGLFDKGVGLGKASLLLGFSDIARMMYFANLIPLSREDIV